MADAHVGLAGGGGSSARGRRTSGQLYLPNGAFTFAPLGACGGGRSAEWVCTGWPPRAALRSRPSPSPARARRPAGKGGLKGKSIRIRNVVSICPMAVVMARKAASAWRARTSLFADLWLRRGRGPRREVRVHRHAGRPVGPIRLGRHTTRRIASAIYLSQFIRLSRLSGKASVPHKPTTACVPRRFSSIFGTVG